MFVRIGIINFLSHVNTVPSWTPEYVWIFQGMGQSTCFVTFIMPTPHLSIQEAADKFWMNKHKNEWKNTFRIIFLHFWNLCYLLINTSHLQNTYSSKESCRKDKKLYFLHIPPVKTSLNSTFSISFPLPWITHLKKILLDLLCPAQGSDIYPISPNLSAPF